MRANRLAMLLAARSGKKLKPRRGGKVACTSKTPSTLPSPSRSSSPVPHGSSIAPAERQSSPVPTPSRSSSPQGHARSPARAPSLASPLLSPSRSPCPATPPTPRSPTTLCPPPDDRAIASATTICQDQSTAPAGCEDKVEDLTEDWWVSDDEQDYPMTDAAYLDEEGEDGELKIAVIDSVRTEAEMEATRAMIEDNRKQNLAVDEWLDAVKDAVDQGEPSGKEEKLNIPDAAVKGKGKEVVVISDDDQ